MKNKNNTDIIKGFDGLALIDLLSVVGVLVVIKQLLIPVTFLYAGPASTFSAMIMATYLLHKRGLSWKDLGLRWPQNWLNTLGLTIMTFVLFVLAMKGMSFIVGIYFEHTNASGRFDHLQGNIKAYLIVMFLTWTHASLFEELLFRAYIINKTSQALGNGVKAHIIAVLFSALFFGYRHHYYQGMYGALTTGAAGLCFALLYLWFGRTNILPLVLAHGIANSLSQTFRFLGVKPD